MIWDKDSGDHGKAKPRTADLCSTSHGTAPACTCSFLLTRPEWECRPRSVGGRGGPRQGTPGKEYSVTKQGCSGDQGDLKKEGLEGVTAGVSKVTVKGSWGKEGQA